MAEYSKSSGVSGNWVDKTDLRNGQRAKIITEAIPVEEMYKGKPKTRNIVKVQFEGDREAKNVDLNRPTVNGLIDAFGTDSKDWMGQYLTVALEKMLIAGQRQTAMYLLPEGFEVSEDSGGYLIVQRMGLEAAPPRDEIGVEDEIDPADIPF